MIQPPFQPYNITFYLEFWTYNSNHRAVHYSFTRLKKKEKKISTAWNNTLLIKWPWLQQQTCNHEQDYTSTAHTHSPAPPLCFLLFSPGISHCCRPSAHRAGEWLDQTSACLALAAKQKHTKEAQCRNHHAQTALCTYSSSGWCVCLLKITKDVDLITKKNTMYVIENNRVHYSVWPRFYWLHDKICKTKYPHQRWKTSIKAKNCFNNSPPWSKVYEHLLLTAAKTLLSVSVSTKVVTFRYLTLEGLL